MGKNLLSGLQKEISDLQDDIKIVEERANKRAEKAEIKNLKRTCLT